MKLIQTGPIFCSQTLCDRETLFVELGQRDWKVWVSLDGLSLMSETSKRMPQRTDRDGESAGRDRRGGGSES